MKLLPILLVFAAAVALAAAPMPQQTSHQRKFTSYSVTGVQRTADNVYTATVNTVNDKRSNAPIPSNGKVVTLNTVDCTHVPAVGPGGQPLENGIVVSGPLGLSLLFSGGITCAVSDLTL